MLLKLLKPLAHMGAVVGFEGSYRYEKCCLWLQRYKRCQPLELHVLLPMNIDDPYITQISRLYTSLAYTTVGVSIIHFIIYLILLVDFLL